MWAALCVDAVGDAVGRWKLYPATVHIAGGPGPGNVLVSPDYVVFRCREDVLLSDYLNHYVRTSLWGRFLVDHSRASLQPPQGSIHPLVGNRDEATFRAESATMAGISVASGC